MFYIPSSPSSPGWTVRQLFVTEAKEPLLLAHVSSSREGAGPVGFWGFAHPRDLERLIDGISKSEDGYEVTNLSVLLHSGMGVGNNITSEEVTHVITNSGEEEQRVFIVRTVENNSYLLGDHFKKETNLNRIVYERDSGRSGSNSGKR